MKTLIDLQKEINRIKNHISVMEMYLDVKREARDWHGVWDAAMDIKGLEDQLKSLQFVKSSWLNELAEKLPKGEVKQNVGESEK